MALIIITLTFDTETEKTKIIGSNISENFELETGDVNITGLGMQVGDYTNGKKIDGYSYNYLEIPLRLTKYTDSELLRKKAYEEYIKDDKS